MDIRNIALVRATNVIPFIGELNPISESQYIKKDMNNYFANAIGELLKKQRDYDLWN
jgi:hypothetical protein